MYKQDINLIPRKKSISAATVASVFLIIIILASFTAAGLYLPKYALESRRVKLTALQDELAGFKDIELVYIRKMSEFSSLNTRKNNFDSFMSSERQVSGLLDQIDKAAPEGLFIIDQVFNTDNIVINGFVTDDLIAADFEQELRRSDIFKDIYLDSLTGTQGQRIFRMTLLHKDVTASGGE